MKRIAVCLITITSCGFVDFYLIQYGTTILWEIVVNRIVQCESPISVAVHVILFSRLSNQIISANVAEILGNLN